jgi:release factor glutamine methyltransferase
MTTIFDIVKKYSSKLDRLDLELIIAHAINSSREFVLMYPEKTLSESHTLAINKMARRRILCEPLAYILGEKEFYGIKFKVDRSTLIPRPETEMMVDLVSNNIKNGEYNNKNKLVIADIGTGSGNIIIALAQNIKHGTWNKFKLYGIDISKKATVIAKQNAKLNKVQNEITFLSGNLLDPLVKIGNWKLEIGNSTMIIVANLPYLSSKIYKSCLKDIKKYEPKSALFSQNYGLSHYEELLKQINEIRKNYPPLHVSCFLEISPEQKNKITALIKKYFSDLKIIFHKDLGNRWRICEIKI